MLGIDRSYIGGLGFGVTACNPASITEAALPDDSDLLLDRPEYWVVNKDVCRNPEEGDELSFLVSAQGGSWVLLDTSLILSCAQITLKQACKFLRLSLNSFQTSFLLFFLRLLF